MRYIGTVMAKELNSVARRKRTFVLRVVLPAFVLFVIILFLVNIDVEYAASTAMMGRVMFYTLAFMVMTAGFFLAPAYTAPLISSEREQKTLEIIRNVEAYERGFYTGVFGYFDGQNLDSSVAIRFIEKQGGKLVFKSGGGITFKSDWKMEYEEMQKKVYVPVY